MSFALSAVIAFFSTPAALAIISGLTLLILSYRDIFWGVAFLSIYTPLEPFLLKFVPNEIYLYLRYGSEVFMIALLIILVLKKAQSRNQKSVIFQRTPLDLPLVLFLFVGLISLILNWGAPWYVGFLGLRQILRYLAIFYLITQAGLTHQQIKRLMEVMILVVLFEVALGLGQAIVGQSADDFLLPGTRRDFPKIEVSATTDKFWVAGQRVFATFGRYDRFGVFLSFFLLIIAGLAFEIKNPRWRRILWAIVIISLPTFFLTYSRLSWLGFFLGLFLIGVILKRSRVLILSFFIALFALSLYLSLYLFYTGARVSRIIDRPYMAPAERILELFSLRGLREGYRGYGRPYFLINTPRKLISRHPLLGVGPWQYGGGVAAALSLHARYDEAGLPFGIAGTVGQIDNNWFSIWGEFCTIGLLAWLAVFFVLARFNWRLWKQSNDPFTKGLCLGFLGAIFASVFEAFFGPYFEVRTLALYLWMFAGLVVALGQNSIKEPNSILNLS